VGGDKFIPSQTRLSFRYRENSMPTGLRRYQQTRDLHSITFSCYRRQPKLATAGARSVFERSLELVRLRYGFFVTGYVVMPEHVHLLVSEPDKGSLATAIQALKQSVSRSLALRASEPFWQARYYDFNVWTEKKRIEKLRYMHRNPVARGLVAKPEDWAWSSFRHYATGIEGVVEIESEWTARKREQMGVRAEVRKGPVVRFPP
jgi:putative transposase